MFRKSHQQLVLDVTSLPTAPFTEGPVEHYIEEFCASRKSLKLKRDSAGNLLVHYKAGRKQPKRPICLAAHMDHPGFVAEKMVSRGRLRAAWYGGVRPGYFKGAKVRFFVDGAWVNGVIQAVRKTGKKGAEKVVHADIAVKQEVPAGSLGMWHLPDSKYRNGRLVARVCDDLSCVAAMLCCMDNLVRDKVQTECWFLFTRAEEVGFAGAIAACRLGSIPRKCVIVAAENSSELSNAKMGDGPILRVGDRLTTYTSAVTSFCNEVAQKLSKSNRRFQYQRKLMDGGACESSAYCVLGYEATGICIALGNYHNMGKNGKIASEYVNIDDLSHLITWFTALVSEYPGYSGKDAYILGRLGEIEKEHVGRLKKSAGKSS